LFLFSFTAFSGILFDITSVLLTLIEVPHSLFPRDRPPTFSAHPSVFSPRAYARYSIPVIHYSFPFSMLFSFGFTGRPFFLVILRLLSSPSFSSVYISLPFSLFFSFYHAKSPQFLQVYQSLFLPNTFVITVFRLSHVRYLHLL